KNISENVASLVYTSGTTGVPKGVMLTNANFISNVDAARKEFSITAKDKFLSFLPLSHVLERTLGSYIPILSGAEIYYSEGIKQLKDNLAEVKPTILICVPKILERFYEGVRDNAEKGSNLKKKIFYFALKNKDNFFADVLVFRKIRKLFGGNLRFCVSGGASINSRILKFFYNAKIKITEGYGLTETSPIISANKLNNLRPGSVGELLEDVQVKISVDKEILVKGANVMKGYWQQAKKTKETFDKDGWFKTGDQGYLDNENFLFITGRKKDLIVTSNGKNIAPEKIENILNLSPYILQSLVVGHKRSNLTVLIVVDKNNIKDINDVKSIIQKEIDMVNKNLEHHEYIKAFELIDHPFSQELGELTPTLKIRRFIVEDKYAKVIERMYVKN
ncbi:MAG: AMP-dependent synthetase/ligase, partial [Candidatus Falkowbacteria bacterium]|nr:AMP-dependent synthetase/ligase [Candidatus Falkowbacteria bacterium]